MTAGRGQQVLEHWQFGQGQHTLMDTPDLCMPCVIDGHALANRHQHPVVFEINDIAPDRCCKAECKPTGETAAECQAAQC